MGTASAAELVIVDLIAQHDVEPDEEAPGQGHLRFGPAAPPKDGEVDALESGIAPGRERRRLAEHPAQERAALFADMPQPVLVRGRADGGRQPDVADHVLAAGESAHGAEHQHGRQRRQRPNAGMGHEATVEARGADGDGRATVEVTDDPQFPDNVGTWMVQPDACAGRRAGRTSGPTCKGSAA